jgi:hypothetical protein
MFGRVVSLVMSYAAVVGLFVEIPIVSNYTFWFMVGAYLLWIAVNNLYQGRRLKVMLMLTIVLAMAAIVGVFVEIPIFSNYAFWVMATAYVLMIASTDIVRTP